MFAGKRVRRSKRKVRRTGKKRGRRSHHRRNLLLGGAYEDVASFPGSTANNTASLYAFNTAAGGTQDPSSPVNTELTRQEPSFYPY